MEQNCRNMVNFLLENAGPSIRYRVKTEICVEITEAEENELQEQIMSEPISVLVAGCQKENGWLGNGFHGPNKNAGPYENQEVGVKFLAEKGVKKDNPVLRRAMEAFVTVPLSDMCYRTRGKVFDEFKYAANGQNIIRCACIARAGYDDIIDIKPQIQLSLDSFRRVTEVDSILDVTRTIKSSRYRLFNSYEKWPCRYHFDILAHTDSWKNQKNIELLAESFKKLMRRDRPELIGVGAASWVGHELGTVGCFSEGYSIRYCIGDGEKSVVNLEAVEWMCRCGLYPYLPALHDEVEYIGNSIDENGICRADIDEEALKNISTYSGLQIEKDWKSETRKMCDITFRALMILKFAGFLE
ncbi:MAG: hypothetical protein ACI4XJ_03710 [Eubacteriales bacterium]